MAFIGNQPTAVPLTSSQLVDGIITTDKLAADAVTSAKILDSTIVNADIASTTINLTQKVTGTLPATNGGTGTSSYTAGNIIYASNATTLTTLAPGTSGQALILNGTTPSWGTLGSDFVLLATTDITSSTASVSFDGYFSATYKNYKVIISNVIPVTDNVEFRIRYRRSNADVTASSYRAVTALAYMNTPGASAAGAGGWQNYSYLPGFNDTLDNTTANGGGSMELLLYNPLSTSNYKWYTSQGGYVNSDNTQWYSNNTAGWLIDSTAALSGLTFYFSSGNIASGNFKLYGIK